MKNYTEAELTEILKLHREWLWGEETGRRADLSDADLRGADLSDADLSDADLSDADLRRADLSDADLRRANLSDANLRRADLRGSNLSDADLSQSNTRHVYGIDIYSLDNIGTYNGRATFIPKYNQVFAGCWTGTLDEFVEKGTEMNGGNQKQISIIKHAYEFFKACAEDIEIEESETDER